MNPEQNERRARFLVLPLNLSYDGSSVSSHPASQMQSHIDSLPPLNTDQQMLNSWPPVPASFHDYNLANAMSLPASQTSTEWAQSAGTPPCNDDQPTSEYYGYSAHTAGRNHETAFWRDQIAGLPRTCTLYEASMLSGIAMASRSCEPSTYMIPSISAEPNGCSQTNGHLNSLRDFATMSVSPKMEIDTFESESFLSDVLSRSRMPAASESSYESVLSSRETTAVEPDKYWIDEPYAKLIYRALMSVPDHAMVLREIYEWFRLNTTKHSSTTNGWKNSIRHNLSMNAVSS